MGDPVEVDEYAAGIQRGSSSFVNILLETGMGISISTIPDLWSIRAVRGAEQPLTFTVTHPAAGRDLKDL